MLALGSDVPSSLGLPFYTAGTAADVGAALAAVARFAPLVDHTARFRFTTEDRYGRLELGTNVEADRFSSDFRLAVLARWVFGWLDARGDFTVCFGYAEPADLAPHRELLPRCELEFGHPRESIVLSREALALPLATSTPDLHVILHARSEELLRRVPSLQTLAERVRSEICTQLREASFSGDTVAEALQLSRRSLVRRLALEGESFSALLARVRHEEARFLLRSTSATISEVAYRLGYASPPPFCRAFARWEGVSASRYRVLSREADTCSEGRTWIRSHRRAAE